MEKPKWVRPQLLQLKDTRLPEQGQLNIKALMTIAQSILGVPNKGELSVVEERPTFNIDQKPIQFKAKTASAIDAVRGDQTREGWLRTCNLPPVILEDRLGISYQSAYNLLQLTGADFGITPNDQKRPFHFRRATLQLLEQAGLLLTQGELKKRICRDRISPVVLAEMIGYKRNQVQNVSEWYKRLGIDPAGWPRSHKRKEENKDLDQLVALSGLTRVFGEIPLETIGRLIISGGIREYLKMGKKKAKVKQIRKWLEILGTSERQLTYQYLERQKVLDRLQPLDKDTLISFFKDGLTLKEIVTQTGVKKTQVIGERLKRALKRAQKLIDQPEVIKILEEFKPQTDEQIFKDRLIDFFRGKRAILNALGRNDITTIKQLIEMVQQDRLARCIGSERKQQILAFLENEGITDIFWGLGMVPEDQIPGLAPQTPDRQERQWADRREVLRNRPIKRQIVGIFENFDLGLYKAYIKKLRKTIISDLTELDVLRLSSEHLDKLRAGGFSTIASLKRLSRNKLIKLGIDNIENFVVELSRAMKELDLLVRKNC